MMYDTVVVTLNIVIKLSALVPSLTSFHSLNASVQRSWNEMKTVELELKLNWRQTWNLKWIKTKMWNVMWKDSDWDMETESQIATVKLNSKEIRMLMTKVTVRMIHSKKRRFLELAGRLHQDTPVAVLKVTTTLSRLKESFYLRYPTSTTGAQSLLKKKSGTSRILYADEWMKLRTSEFCGNPISAKPMCSGEDVDGGWSTLPKVELHAHLGGSVRITTVADLLTPIMGRDAAVARAQAVAIPLCCDGVPLECSEYHGFAIVKSAVDSGDRQMQTQNTRRIVMEYLEDCVDDGIMYVELRTGGESLEKLECVLNSMHEFYAIQPSLVSRLIVSIKRDGTPEAAWTCVRNAVMLKERGVVAIDFCGLHPNQHPFNPQFADAIAFAQQSGLSFVCHFAETIGETDLESLLNCHPARLGHAVLMPPHIKRCVLDRRIPIECCLSSNLNVMRRDGHIPPAPATTVSAESPMTQATTNTLVTGECGNRSAIADVVRVHHPVAEWNSTGHPFILCCDNVGLLGFKLSKLYRITAEALTEPKRGTTAITTKHQQHHTAWTWALDSIEFICAGPEVKSQLRARLNQHPWRYEKG
ncbi:Metallo-dependent hydrolase [Pelomyxa schiedti]|nr:Metallo-dependent hydrolase [Pelomyxa schiedti]